MSKRLQIKDLYDNTQSLFHYMQEFENQAWYQHILDHADDFIIYRYSLYTLIDSYQRSDINLAINFVKKNIDMTIISNAYTFKNMYDSTQFVYNPLWNVDGTEITERVYNSQNKNVQTLNTTQGVTHDSTTTNNDVTIDDTTHTHTIDENENVSQANTAEVTNQLYLREQDDTVKSANNVDKDTGTTTRNVDSKINEHTDTTQGGTIDDDRNIQDNEYMQVTRQGNIGVTKTTDLIDSQRNTVQFNYLEYVCHIIISEFCLLTF